MQESTAIEITIVIPARNEASYLEDCIKGVEEALINKCIYEIVVVDNNSNDATFSIAEK